MIKIGITGQAGFIGTHLYNLLGIKKGFERVNFKDEFFSDKNKLRTFVKKCDVIVHFAALNRHDDENVIYETNLKLVRDLISVMEEEKVKPHVLFSSSSQEKRDNLCGKSKREGRTMFQKLAQKNEATFTGLVIPNVFGPFGKPYYNSFIATFCHQLNNNEKPQIKVDSIVKLIFVGTLCEIILDIINDNPKGINKQVISHYFENSVSDILTKLGYYKRPISKWVLFLN